jgi:hypothetical protein
MKDQLTKYKETIDKLIAECDEHKVQSKKNNDRWLSSEQDRADLSKENDLLRESLNNAVAFARINSRGDLYDLRLQQNPHIDETTVLPLYSNREEFKKMVEELKLKQDR